MSDERIRSLRLARSARREPSEISISDLLPLLEADERAVRENAVRGIRELSKHGPAALEPADEDITSVIDGEAEDYPLVTVGALAAVHEPFVEVLDEKLGDPADTTRRSAAKGVMVLARCDVDAASPFLDTIVDRFSDINRPVEGAKLAATHIVARRPERQSKLIDALHGDEQTRANAGRVLGNAIGLRVVMGNDPDIFEPGVKAMISALAEYQDDSMIDGLRTIAGGDTLQTLEGHAGEPDLLLDHIDQLIDIAVSDSDVSLGPTLGLLGKHDQEVAERLYNELTDNPGDYTVLLNALKTVVRYRPDIIVDTSLVRDIGRKGNEDIQRSAERILERVSEKPNRDITIGQDDPVDVDEALRDFLDLEPSDEVTPESVRNIGTTIGASRLYRLRDCAIESERFRATLTVMLGHEKRALKARSAKILKKVSTEEPSILVEPLSESPALAISGKTIETPPPPIEVLVDLVTNYSYDGSEIEIEEHSFSTDYGSKEARNGALSAIGNVATVEPLYIERVIPTIRERVSSGIEQENLYVNDNSLWSAIRAAVRHYPERMVHHSEELWTVYQSVNEKPIRHAIGLLGCVDREIATKLVDEFEENGRCEALRFISRDAPEHLIPDVDLFLERFLTGDGPRAFAGNVLADIAATHPSAVEEHIDDIRTALVDPLESVRGAAVTVLGSYYAANNTEPASNKADKIYRVASSLGEERPIAIATLVLAGHEPPGNDPTEAAISKAFREHGSYQYRKTLVTVEALRSMKTQSAYRHLRAHRGGGWATVNPIGDRRALTDAIEDAYEALSEESFDTK